jgi:nucleoside transporter
VSDTPRLSGRLNFELSFMMFLQYAIWGAWLPLFWPFLANHRGLEGEQIGTLFSLGATGALVAPFIAGQIADRWFNTEKFLALSHLVGAALVWQLAVVETYNELLVYSILYSFVYAPTLPLTNSLAFHHLPDRDRDFGKVRVWGTVGWIAVGIGIGQWLFRTYPKAEVYAGMGDSLRLSAILGVVLGVYCFFLPRTPPQPGKRKFAPGEAFAEIMRGWKSNPLFWLFVIAFPVSCIHQFYFVRTADFLGKKMPASPFIDSIFGVGGGGLMTIGQIAEIAVLAFMPVVAKRFSRKGLLATGLVAYIVRFAVFAYLPYAWAVIPALALHGFCFGCFFFVAFMIVDEQTTGDVRASAQGLFNLVIVGLGVIVGNYFAGQVSKGAKGDFSIEFSIPMWIAIGCLVALLLAYPKSRRPA